MDNKNENNNRLPKVYSKRAKIGGNILCSLAIVVLIIIVLPLIVSFIDSKEYDNLIIVFVFLVVIVIPVFFAGYILKKKPTKILKPGTLRPIKPSNSKEKRTLRETIINEINKNYGVDKPYKIFKYSIFEKNFWDLYLDQTIVYDCGDYWHLITIGIFDFCEMYEKPAVEYTFKLKKKNEEIDKNELIAARNNLEKIARKTVYNIELYKEYQYLQDMSTTEEQCYQYSIDFKQESKFIGFITVPETKLESINIPNCKLDFVEFIGITGDELKAVIDKQITVEDLYKKIGTDVTDYDRNSVV